MAVAVTKLDFTSIHSILGAIQPELTRTDNQRMLINGHPMEIFLLVSDASGATDLNITTKLALVQGGALMDSAGDWSAFPIRPLSTNASVAVVTGVIPAAADTFILLVYGTETLN